VYQLFIPISVFALITFSLTSFLVFYGLPWGNRGFGATLFLIAQSRADIEIKERVFNDMFSGMVIYVDRVPIQGNRMEGILIYDGREKDKSNTIIAREGFLINDPESQEIILRLNHGDIHRYEPRVQTFQKIKFETYDLKLELSKALLALGRKLKEYEMSIDEIRKRIEILRIQRKDTTSLQVELYKRYTIPFTCIVFALIGVPLGIQPHRSGRSYGFILSILILLIYYIFVMAFESLAMNKTIPPHLAGIAPTFLFGCLGIYLLIKASRESPFKPAVWLIEGIDGLQRKWKRFVGND
jgi:lipopolysaccharide export system permease protein